MTAENHPEFLREFLRNCSVKPLREEYVEAAIILDKVLSRLIDSYSDADLIELWNKARNSNNQQGEK